MAETNFGKFIRRLRIRNHEVLGDTAKLLGVSTSFLSAVENGKKDVPIEWVDIISKHYNLNKEEIEVLNEILRKGLKSNG